MKRGIFGVLIAYFFLFFALILSFSFMFAPRNFFDGQGITGMAVQDSPISGFNIIGCGGVLNSSGKYLVTRQIELYDSGNGVCINISAPNVEVDCNNNKIIMRGVAPKKAIYSNKQNSSIKNCFIDGGGSEGNIDSRKFGFFFENIIGGAGILVQNNVVYNASEGITIFNSTNVKIIGNKFLNVSRGVRLSGISELVMSDNLILINNSKASYHGFTIRNGSRIYVLNNTMISNNSVDAIYPFFEIYGVTSGEIYKNEIKGGYPKGISIFDSENVNFSGNKITGFVKYGIIMEQSAGNRFIANVLGNTYDIYNSSGNLSDNYFEGNNYSGFIIFNGKDQYAYRSNITGIFNTSLTVSFWVKRDIGGNILYNKTVLNLFGNNSFLVYLSSDGKYYASIRALNKTGKLVKLSAVIGNASMDDNWHNVIINFDSDIKKLSSYFDGKYVASVTFENSIFKKDGSLFIAAGSENSTKAIAGSYFNGSIDDIRIYNYSLGVLNMSNISRSGRIGSAQTGYGIAAWYKFDEAEGNAALDNSVFNNHLILISSPFRTSIKQSLGGVNAEAPVPPASEDDEDESVESANVRITANELNSGKLVYLILGDEISFNLSGRLHYLNFDDIINDRSLFLIDHSSRRILISFNATKRVDFNSDDVDDVSIKYSIIADNNNRAGFYLKIISEPGQSWFNQGQQLPGGQQIGNNGQYDYNAYNAADNGQNRTMNNNSIEGEEGDGSVPLYLAILIIGIIVLLIVIMIIWIYIEFSRGIKKKDNMNFPKYDPSIQKKSF